MIGKTIRHYRIESKLGEGGMGIVYRAHDLNLNRMVALKILPPDKVADAKRKQRFMQEARMASALNHPNIITVHDIASEAGVEFIVMEYIRGKTLDQVTRRRGLKVGEALRYAGQIADALAAAHGAGIIHRDLKPSNVMVLDDERVKVLDFGLAKLTEPEPVADDEPTRTLGPANPLTEEGQVVGTIAYMSPEQAQGKNLDFRSDVFSFGSLLFEMLTGRRAFQRDTNIATLSAILREEPAPMTELAPQVPREVENLVLRCLRKDVRRRPQHFGDLKLALEELREQSESGMLPGAPAPPPRLLRPLWATLLLFVLIAATFAGWKLWWQPSAAPPVGPVLTRLTSDAGLTMDPAISSDGKLLAYASDRAGTGNLDIWVQQMAGGEPLRLTTGPADNRQPDFSPDGTRIVFRSDRDGGGIYVVSTFGAGARLLAKRGITPRFSPDGEWIAYQIVNALACKIYVVPAAGGESRQLDPAFADAHSPIWSPDGKSVLVIGRVKLEMPIDLWYVLPADGSRAIEIAARDRLTRAGVQLSETIGSLGVWLRPPDAVQDVVLFRGRLKDAVNVWQLPLDRKTLQPAGQPARLTLGLNEEWARSAQNDAPGKRIVFASMEVNVDLYSVSLDARHGTPAGEPQRLTEDLAPDTQPFLSTDGHVLLYHSNRGGAVDLRKRTFPGAEDVSLGFAALKPYWAVLSRDASRVAFSTQERRVLYLAASSGAYPKTLCDDCGIPQDLSPDNRVILYAPGSFRTINSLDIASGKKTVVLRDPSRSLSGARFSPDGGWIAFYTVNPILQVWIAPFRPGMETPVSEWVEITTGAQPDVAPAWSSDGKLLYYLSDRDGFRCVWTQPVVAGKPSGAPLPVLHFHNARLKPRTTAANVVDLTIARDKIVVALVEQTGNIWMASR